MAEDHHLKELQQEKMKHLNAQSTRLRKNVIKKAEAKANTRNSGSLLRKEKGQAQRQKMTQSVRPGEKC